MNREDEIIEKAGIYSSEQSEGKNEGIDDFCFEAFCAGARWADEHPVCPWHSVKDGDIPPFNKACLFNCNGTVYIGFVRGDESLYLEKNLDLSLSINDIDYWMEISKLPTELE